MVGRAVKAWGLWSLCCELTPVMGGAQRVCGQLDSVSQGLLGEQKKQVPQGVRSGVVVGSLREE